MPSRNCSGSLRVPHTNRLVMLLQIVSNARKPSTLDLYMKCGHIG